MGRAFIREPSFILMKENLRPDATSVPSVFTRWTNSPLPNCIAKSPASRSLPESSCRSCSAGGGCTTSMPLVPVMMRYGPMKRRQRFCLWPRPVMTTSASVSERSFEYGCSWSVAATYTFPSEVRSTNQFHSGFISSRMTAETTPVTETNQLVSLPSPIWRAPTFFAFGSGSWPSFLREVTINLYSSVDVA